MYLISHVVDKLCIHGHQHSNQGPSMTTHTFPIHNVEFDALYLITDVTLLVDLKYRVLHVYSTLTI